MWVNREGNGTPPPPLGPGDPARALPSPAPALPRAGPAPWAGSWILELELLVLNFDDDGPGTRAHVRGMVAF